MERHGNAKPALPRRQHRPHAVLPAGSGPVMKPSTTGNENPVDPGAKLSKCQTRYSCPAGVIVINKRTGSDAALADGLPLPGRGLISWCRGRLMHVSPGRAKRCE